MSLERFDVRGFRERYGLNQIQLAEKLGVTSRTVRRWEIDKLTPAPNATRSLERVKKELEREARARGEDPSQPLPSAVQQQRAVQAHTGLSPEGLRRKAMATAKVATRRPRSHTLAAVLPSFGH